MATSKRGSSASSRGSGTSKRRKKAGGPAPIKLILYPLSVLGGLYLGVQFYAHFLRPAEAARARPAGRTASQKRLSPARARQEKPRPVASRPKEEEPEEETPVVSVRPSTPVQKVPGIEIDRATTGRPEVALTFDAGADWKPARQILDTLQKEGVTSTFFLTGEWVKQNPKTTQRITAEGHEVGNHSWDHPAFTTLSEDEIKSQLDRTEAIIKETTGRSSRPYFRPPLGARDDRVRGLVGDNGYFSIYWTLDSHDSVVKGITASEIKERVLEGIAPGSIVLLHCGSQATADALPEILAGLKQRNLKPVLLSKLLAK